MLVEDSSQIYAPQRLVALGKCRPSLFWPRFGACADVTACSTGSSPLEQQVKPDQGQYLSAAPNQRPWNLTSPRSCSIAR
jgi:hypothetical protein